MQYGIARTLALAMAGNTAAEVVRRAEDVLTQHRDELVQALVAFACQEVTPESTFAFETQLAGKCREIARRLLEVAFNLLEPETSETLPHDVVCGAEGFRRLNDKTPHRFVGTLFGTIELWRYGYRPWDRDSESGVIFPLESQLGLIEGTTPGLAERVGLYMAAAGATQRTVLECLKQQHGVSWGANRLRKVTQRLSQDMGVLTQKQQVDRLLELLQQAQAGRGRGRPTLGVGRDGVTLREYRYRFFENASVATVTVYDRRGHRLGTVYLAFVPELGQGTMTERLTALLLELLRCWEGPLPQLAYVTDAGESETQYFRQVLRRMTHPRSGERLKWTRVVDYYHASQRLWTMAEALFGKDSPTGRAWARRMCRVLKETNGPSRVLHSAAALRATRKLSKNREADYQRATNYIRQRTKAMRYQAFKKRGLPIGSGVTEAACKTIVAQRLKLSGMRWSKAGAQPILDLRVVLLSGTWAATYREHLRSLHNPRIETHGTLPHETLQIAA